MNNDKVSKNLEDHYRKTFARFGATSQGVDWGKDEATLNIRYSKMLEVINPEKRLSSLLDVGCGYGGLLDFIQEKKIKVEYTGIDLVEEMIFNARRRYSENSFIVGNVLKTNLSNYDYIVCNGVLTQKLNVSTLEMNHFAQQLIKRIFQICNYGIVFNLMNTFVNYQKDNLYYRNPSELMAWCMSEISPRVKIDCSYDLRFEYTVYIYK